MKTTRAILIGALIWLIIFSLFGLLNFIPAVSQSQTWQGLIIDILHYPGSWLGSRYLL